MTAPAAAGEATSPVQNPHATPAADVLSALSTTTDAGLTDQEAQQRLTRFGANRLPAPPKDGAIKRFLQHFDDVLIYILLASAVLKAILGEWIDFWVILGVAVINAVIGFIQEGRAEDALEGIRKMLSLNALARRDGEWREVEAENLVPGDIVALKSGDKVPADLRLIEAVNLSIEESALTGEAVAAEKTTGTVAVDAGVGDRSSMAFSGTLVAAGQGVGVVTATGSGAEIGKIQTMISEVESFDTPLTKEITAFGKQLSLIILGMAVFMVLVGRFLHDFGQAELVSATIGFAVAAIPEGLPALVTITLALGVQQMARRNAIIRKLPAVETLGAVTVICSDKTGTLTKNEMTVRHIVTRDHQYDVEGIGYQPEGALILDGAGAALDDHADLKALVMVMAVNNDSEIIEQDGEWRALGAPTEAALRTLGLKAGFEHAAYEQLGIVPFESEHKYMVTLNVSPSGARLFMLKGAPDRVLDRSSLQQRADGGTEPLDRQFWDDRIDALSAEGLRVLAAAIRSAPEGADVVGHDDVESEMVFLGLVGIVDPPRPEAIEAIATSHRAGIRVKMITGDHAGTASAIAREMGLSDSDSESAVTGAELEAATNEELRKIVKTTDTFARTSPEHKIRIVKALQANGEVVAMTGDGVNDAPALKRADVGVAMGIKGTEATKEAAEVVLTDDNFASIERAVEEGRRIYDNLQKSIVFLLPTNGAQSLVILIAVLFGLTLPLEPVQILWINMVSAITLALALAYEPAEPNLMTRAPRKPGSSILPRKYLGRIAYVSILIAGATLIVFYVAQAQGLSREESQTMAVTMLAFGQAAYLLNAKSLRESSIRRGILTENPIVIYSIGALILFQLLFVYAPFMNNWFQSAPLDLAGWLIPLALSVLLFFLIEGGKVLFRRFSPEDQVQLHPGSAGRDH